MKSIIARFALAPAILALAACGHSPTVPEKQIMSDGLISDIRSSAHQGGNDLLSAGLGLEGLRGGAPAFADPANPTVPELRRRAIYSSWRGIADLGPLGGYGEVYGAVPRVGGREFTAFAQLDGATQPHRVLLQLPDDFDRDKRCLVVSASSGSRGIYGAIAFAGAWGLPRGCAVAYTDKGAGSGYFDVATASGVSLDGARAVRGDAQLEFAPDPDESVSELNQVLVKHAHSGDNPEADWGRHVVQAARFALRALDQALPDQAPFTPDNTRIIAAGVSNGGGAVLRAAEIDEGMFDGVVAIEPNIWAGEGGRALYDYATEAALFAPCALLDRRFDNVSFARINAAHPPAWVTRCQTLQDAGLLSAGDTGALAAESLLRLQANGWTNDLLVGAATTTALDLWRAVSVTYAAAYARTGVAEMPCGFGIAAMDAGNLPHPPTAIEAAAWWSDASGIPPGAGVGIVDTLALAADRSWPGTRCLAQLWSDPDARGSALHVSVQETRASLPREDLPIFIVHGEDDGLIPIAFSSGPYVKWIEANGRRPSFWRVANAQHFDAFLAFPGFGDSHVPLLPHAYAAMDRMWAHVFAQESLPGSASIATTPRGNGPLDADQLGEFPLR
ncbi:3-hydroxybutyrate oligomer hydrolase family protein [Dokdonella sp.]|uniref:3-hydroxybutyrate oligomer hydrolase family protein n=1 Tax=Dokdonella sp. TaxID=2291710 RepID=UPI003C56C03E